MLAVLDTNVLISGLLWRGVPHHCLLAAEGKLYTLVSAESILQELQQKLIQKFRNTFEEADSSVAGIRNLSLIVPLTGQHGWVLADPDDDKFIEAALAGNADVIVSGDHHLLSLGLVEGIAILSPRKFLDLLSQEPAT